MESCSLWHTVIQRIQAHILAQQWSVRDCRVLLPHPALLPLATQAWKQCCPSGYTPRFCTLNAWVQESGQWQPDWQDVAFAPYQDAQTARQLLARVRSASVQSPWPQWLIKNSYAAAAAAAAIEPKLRQAWYTQMQAILFPEVTSPWGATEQMLLQTALAWAGHSRYASDALWSQVEAMRLGVQGAQASLVFVSGAQALTPLEKALMAGLGPDQTLHLSLPDVQAMRSGTSCNAVPERKQAPDQAPLIRVFEAASAYDEAAIAAHCVLAHVMAQRSPVALVALDRQQVRQIQAMLRCSGVKVRDETGCLLSTSAGAGRLLALLQACQAQAGASDCLHALRAMPSVAARATDGLEQQARQHSWKTLSQLLQAARQTDSLVPDGRLVEGLELLDRYRAKTGSRETAGAWLRCVHELMGETGLHDWLAQEPEGQSLLAHLPVPELQSADPELDTAPAQMLWSFGDWLGALRETLEAAAHIPEAPESCDVCILPLHHLPGRSFAAVVLPGCSDKTLPAVPKPTGFWGQKQRSALGLPTHSDASAAQRTAFECALRWPRVDLLWASSSDGQTRFASPLLQSALQGCLALPAGALIEASPDPRPVQHLPVRPWLAPQASAAHRLPKRLSATAYNDLRTCPYRFFAMRMLGLRPIKALDEQADARDQGQWLHAVLKLYHERRASAGWREVLPQRDLQLLQELSVQVLNEMHLRTQDMWHLWQQKEVLFEAYLRWQAEHETHAYHFLAAETWLERTLGSTVLHGQIDRIDALADGSSTLLIDYKLSKAGRVKERLKPDAEDVQLPFYALLQQGEAIDDGIAAAFVSLHAQDGVCDVPMPHLASRARRLAAGITQDMARIAQGSVLLASGQAQACEYCEARGLCRKDNWQA